MRASITKEESQGPRDLEVARLVTTLKGEDTASVDEVGMELDLEHSKGPGADGEMIGGSGGNQVASKQ